MNCASIFVILIIIVVIIIYIMRSMNINKNPYIVKDNHGFGGTSINELLRPQNFYSINRNATLRYLYGVYPTAKNDLDSLNDLELASFYNSLWFYFNCNGQYNDKDLGSFTGKYDDTTWSPLPCKNTYPLPYTSQGWLYNFYTYNKFNIPEIFSDSDNSKTYLKVENASSGRAGIVGTYVNKNTRSSGIMWITQRAIQRNIWHPNGLFNAKPLNSSSSDDWKITVGKYPSFGFPNGWYGKLGNYQYIEVTHSPSYTGDVPNMSPFWWYNATVGSGLFLNLGKTLAVKNKIAGIFVQCEMLSKTVNGRILLKKWYNSINPYEITWGIIGLCGYNMTTGQQYCDFSKQACGYACNPDPIGYYRATNLAPMTNFYQRTLEIQKNTLGVNEQRPNETAIKMAIDLAIDNKDYILSHISEQLLPDETNFFLGINLELDTIQFFEDPNGNDNYVFEIIDLRIPKKYRTQAKNRDYSGFMKINNPNSKPTINPNDHSRWIDPGTAFLNSYKEEAINEYLKDVYDNNWLSIRNPFDIYNDDKILKCQGLILEKICNGQYAQNMYCSNLPLLNEYKCISLGNDINNNSCILNGDNPTC